MKEKIEEEAINRRLRLQIETLRSPERIERSPTTAHDRAAASSTLVLERVAPFSADKAIVAARGDIAHGVAADEAHRRPRCVLGRATRPERGVRRLVAPAVKRARHRRVCFLGMWAAAVEGRFVYLQAVSTSGC